jgi:hypothetical protein
MEAVRYLWYQVERGKARTIRRPPRPRRRHTRALQIKVLRCRARQNYDAILFYYLSFLIQFYDNVAYTATHVFWSGFEMY